jgi:hypothetical protein
MGALQRRYGKNVHGVGGERRYLVFLVGIGGAQTVWAPTFEKAIRKAQEMAERLGTSVEDVKEG